MGNDGNRASCRGLILALLTLTMAAGCADLSAIQKYAKISTEAAQYTKLVDEYVEYPSRLKRYGERFAQEYEQQQAQREAQKEGLLTMHQTVAEYMAALGALAADDVVVYDKELDGLDKAITDAKFAEKNQAAAAGALAKLIGRAATDSWRQKKLKELILTADSNLQVVIGGLQNVMQGFRVDLDGEAGAIKSYYGMIKQKSSDAAGILALDEWRIYYESTNQKRRAAVDDYSTILTDIGKGHSELAQHADDLEAKQLVQQMKQYTKELEGLFNAVKNL